MTSPFAESEYSPEAESAYADFVASGAQGGEAFEALCAEHEELADELEGLHADFAGVAGVLRCLREREARAQPGTAPLPASAAPAVARGAGRSWVTGLALALIALVVWIAVERQATARERSELNARLAEQQARTAEESRARADAAQEARLARALAQAAERRVVLSAYASRLARAQALVEAGLPESASNALEAVPHERRGWEWSHLAALVEQHLRAQSQRRLVEAAFDPLREERLARAVSAWQEWLKAEREPARDGPPPAEVVELGQGLAYAAVCETVVAGQPRRFEVGAQRLRVFEPGFDEPLLELALPRPAAGVAFEDGRLWLRFEDGTRVVWE